MSPICGQCPAAISAILLATICGASGQTVKTAESVQLVDGRLREGHVVSIGGAGVVLRSGGKEETLPRSELL